MNNSFSVSKWICFAAATLMAGSASAQSPPGGPPVGPGMSPPVLDTVVKFPRGVTMHGDVVFASPRGFRPLTLDLYLPKSRKPLPLLIFVHGGGWAGGTARSAEIVGDNFPAMFAEFSAKGYAVASISYRLSSEAKFPAQVQDLNAAIHFLKTKAQAYGIDAERIVVWGASAGAHIAMLSALDCKRGQLDSPATSQSTTTSTCVTAVVDWFGPTTLASQTPSPTALTYIGCPPSECSDKWQRASVLESLTADAPPFLIVHGDADTTVPYAQSKELLEGLKRHTVMAELHTVPNGNHLFRGAARADIDQAIEATFAFVEKQLQPKAIKQ
jgi:acetyl esterase/lipase